EFGLASCRASLFAGQIFRAARQPKLVHSRSDGRAAHDHARMPRLDQKRNLLGNSPESGRIERASPGSRESTGPKLDDDARHERIRMAGARRPERKVAGPLSGLEI